MNLKRTLSLLLLALGTTGAWAATSTVIVEFDGDPGAVHRARLAQSGQDLSDDGLAAYRAGLLADQDAVLAQAAAAGIPVQVATTPIHDHTGAVAGHVERRYTLVYNGAAVNVSIDQVAALRQVAGIKGVHRDRMLRTQLNNSVDYIRAPELYGAIAELSQFDDIREGFEGQGINVSVIDTGIEWQHEMFGGDPTPPRSALAQSSALIPENEKVIYYMPMSDLAVEDGFGHGTHVASTAAGYRGFAYGADNLPLTADDVAVHGVAPQARIMAYGVCLDVVSTVGALTGAIGGCLTSNTILALEDSVSPRTLNGFAKPVAHVINLSLGGAFGTPDDPTAVASSNAALMGAVVVAAAGNSGDVAGIVGSPSTGTRVISVAASTDPGVVGHSINVLDLAGAPTIPATLPSDSNAGLSYDGGIAGHYVFAGFADTPDQVPDNVSGRICLVERGSTVDGDAAGSGLFTNKASQCQAKGAVATVVFNNEPGEIGGALAPTPMVLLTISRENGLYLRDTLGFDANGLSNHAIRLNGQDPSLFQGDVAGFSSRGPVAGLGQVKPDLSAPGVEVLAAVPPASLMGGLEATRQGPSYGNSDGTSMATPHVAGAAALVKQANPGWHPDQVRTALINTSTPFRDRHGNDRDYAASDRKLHAQGGGLIDVHAAANARALFGVLGDGVDAPSILGSHSFGAEPLLGSDCESEYTVEVALVDQRGTGGSYSVSAFGLRPADGSAMSFVVPAGEVTVPAGGSASFETGVRIDAAAVDASASFVDFQWFVIAERTDGSETLSMPMFLRGTPSVPGEGIGGLHDHVESFTGTHLGGAAAVVFLANHDIQVPLGTLSLRALLEGDELVDGAVTEINLRVIYDDGSEEGVIVAESARDGNFEFIEIANPTPGSYNVQVRGDLGLPTGFDLTVTQRRVTTPEAAAVAPIATEYTDQSGAAIDFDGAFTVNWSATGAETGFVVEQQQDGGAWTAIASPGPGTTSLALSGLGDGDYAFRVISRFAGVICTFEMDPGPARSVTVHRREAVTLDSSQVSTRIQSASFAGGIFSVNVALSNGSGTWLNPIELDIVAVHSASGTVRVINADNCGDGVNGAGSFGYQAQLGDEVLSPGEMSGTRTVVFDDPAGELFTFDAVVRAYRKLD